MPPQFLVVFSLTPPQMGLSCCLTMATIVPKTIRDHRYYYLVQTAWVNGRSRYVKQLYLGKAEDIGKLFEEATAPVPTQRSEEHTSELQSHSDLVCRLLLEKKKETASHIQPALDGARSASVAK